ncbi:MAG: hypothetical protein Q9190_004043 [Brigantiaea leucoxantha]
MPWVFRPLGHSPQVPTGEAKTWLCIMAIHETHIPMYQVIRILRLAFNQSFESVETRELYKSLEAGREKEWLYARGLERGYPYLEHVLSRVEELRQRVEREERE